MEELDILTITRRSVHSVIALISRQFFLQIISTFSFVVISSFLLPSDIGIYTAVIAVQRIINFFTDFGFGAALVQKKEKITDEDIATTFTLQGGITLLIVVLVFLFRDQIAQFFNLNESGLRLLLVLVFTLFLSSFKTIPAILLERTVNFSKLIIPQIIEQLAFHIILIFLVIGKQGLDSYSWAFFVSGLVGVPFYYIVSPWKISIGIHRESLAHLKFGAQFQAKNILATIKDDFLTVILTRVLTFTEIGYIGFAQRIAFLVYRYVVDSVTKVTFSTYSRIQENTEHLRKGIEKSLFFVSAAMFPALVGVMIVAPYFIAYFPKWQNKWEPALVSLIFFCLNAMVSSLSGILVNVLDATGRVKTTLRLMVLWTGLTWILTPLLVFLYGYNGVAAATFLVTLTIVYTVKLVKQFVSFNLIDSIKAPSISTIIMGSVVFLLTKLMVHSMFSLLFVILIGGGVYTLFLFLLSKRELIQDFKLISRRYEQT